MKIQILMSSYNGETYIREQIESLLTQSLCTEHNNMVEILIRDDGSTDSTCDILQEYQDRYGQVRYVRGENIGVIASFFELVRMSDTQADYLALSDQDDVWKQDKMQLAVEILSKEDNQIPLLYCGMVQPTDEKLNPIDTIFFTEGIEPSFGNAIVENICTGCTMVLNQKLADYIREDVPEYTAMHDWWFYILATCFGKVIYDKTPHMFYRQHGGNTVGVKKNYVSEFFARVKRFQANRYQISKQITSLQKLSQRNGWEISKEKQCLVQNIIDLRHHVGARWRLVRNKKVYRQRKGDNLIFKLIILTGTL